MEGSWVFLRKLASKLIANFMEFVENLLECRSHLSTSSIDAQFLRSWSNLRWCDTQKSTDSHNFVRYIDKNVILINRPKRCETHKVKFDGLKRKHALKFQTIISPDGLIKQAFDQWKKWQAWTPYTKKELRIKSPTDIGSARGKFLCTRRLKVGKAPVSEGSLS